MANLKEQIKNKIKLERAIKGRIAAKAFDTTSVFKDATGPTPPVRTPVQPQQSQPEQKPEQRGNFFAETGRKYLEQTRETPGVVGDLAMKAGGYIGDKLGKAVGSAVGFALGGVTSDEKDIAGRFKDALSEAKRSAEATGRVGAGSVGGGLSLYPKAIQTAIDITPLGVKVIGGKEEEFIDYVAEKFVEQVPDASIEQARNYLVTGNIEGDVNKIDNKEVMKAWYASLLPIGMDLYIASSLATSAYNGFYEKNTTAGWKPKYYKKIDFGKGFTEVIKEGERTITARPARPGAGTAEVTVSGPSAGRRLSQPVTRPQAKIALESKPGAPEIGARGAAEPTGVAGLIGREQPGQLQQGVRGQLPVRENAIPMPAKSPEPTPMRGKGESTAIQLGGVKQKIAENKKVIDSGRASKAIKKQTRVLEKLEENLEKKEGISDLQDKQRAKIKDDMAESDDMAFVFDEGPNALSDNGGHAFKTPKPAETKSTSKERLQALIKKGREKPKPVTKQAEVKAPKLEQKISKAKARGESFDEFIKGQGETLYHGTIEKSALSIEKEGFKFRKGKVGAENSITKKLVGDVIYFADTPKATKGFARTEFMVEPSIVEISSSNLNIAGLNDIKKGLSGIEKINYLKAKGFDGLKTGSNDIAIWNIDKIKTKSQLKQLWDKGEETRNLPADEFVKKAEAPKESEKIQKALAKVRAEKSVGGYTDSLLVEKRHGKTEDNFKRLYEKEFDKEIDTPGEFSKSEAILDFMEDQFGFSAIKYLLDPIKPLENILNQGWTSAWTYAYSKTGTKKAVQAMQTALQDTKIVDTLGRKIIYEYRLPEWHKKLKGAMEKEKIKGKLIAKELMNYLSDGLTEAEKIQLHGAIINHGNHPDTNIANRARVARKYLDEYGDRYWQAGAISREVYEQNKGSYLARAYYGHELKDTVARWVRNGGYKADLSRAKKRGTEKVVRTNMVVKWENKGWQDRGELSTRKGYSRIWRDWTESERTAMGEITSEPAYLVSKTISQVSEDAALLDFFKEVAKHDKFVQEEELPGFKQIPSTKTYGELGGKWVEPHMYEDIVGTIEVRDLAASVGDKMLGGWKKFKVIDNPSTHARNIMFNFILSDIAGLPPTRVDVYGRAFMEVLHTDSIYKEAELEGLYDTSFIGNEMGALLEDKKFLNLKKDKNGVYKQNWKEMLGDNALTYVLNMKKYYTKGQASLAKLYEAEEHWNKTALYIFAKEDLGMVPKDAAAYAKKWGLNYSAVTPAVQKFSKKWYGMPFVRFQRQALPRVIEGAATRPFTFVKWLAMAYGFNEYSKKKLGIGDKRANELRKLFPDWMKDGLYILGPSKDRYGSYQYFDMTYIIPFVEDLKAPNLFNYLFGNPFFKIPAELLLNRSAYTGEDIWDNTNNPGLNNMIAAYGKHVWTSIVPPLAPGGYSFEKIRKSIMKEKDYVGRLKDLNTVIKDTIFGIKFRPIDVEKEKKWRLIELEQRFNAHRSKMMSITSDQSKSESQKKKEINALMMLVEKVSKEASEIRGIETTLFD